MKTKFLWIAAVLFTFAANWRAAANSTLQFKTIYEFGVSNNIPGSELTIGPTGKLFGTTYGGAYSDGAGSVYELEPQPDGTFDFYELYRFDTGYSPPSDGQNPYAGLTLSPDGATLYGTAQNGGSTGLGITFSLNIAQAEGASVAKPQFGWNDSYNILHMNTMNEGGSSRSTDAEYDDFIDFAIFLFGTVQDSGKFGDYGAFTGIKQSSTGVDVVVVVPFEPVMGTHPQGRLNLGATPPPPPGFAEPLQKPLAGSTFSLSNLTVYGVCNSGGSNNWGTIYSVRADGSNFTVLHYFTNSPADGSMPQGGMVLSGNTLYGTASSGGTNFSGTIFKINTDGSGFKVLACFNSSTTGTLPEGDIILSGDTLYGTTYYGGTNGGGTVYSIKTNGAGFTVLHSFQSPMDDGLGHYTNSDGGWSVSGLAISGNKLFGTTPYGGTNGVGTAYEIILPGPPSLNLVPSSGSIKLLWPSSATNYVLQSNSTLNALTWSNSSGFSDDGTNRSVIISPPKGNAFFRLLSTNGL